MSAKINDGLTSQQRFVKRHPQRRLDIGRKSYRRSRAKKIASTSAYIRTPHGRYRQLISKCKKRGWEMNLSEEQYVLLLTLPCTYCGDSLNETGTGLDRLNSDLGYVTGNVVPSCGRCNIAKNDLNLEDFKTWIRRVYSRLYGETV